MTTDLEEGKLWNQTLKLCFKIILVSHPACAEGLGKYIDVCQKSNKSQIHFNIEQSRGHKRVPIEILAH